MPYRIKEMAGKPYRPSNGTEGTMFIEQFCDQCEHCPEDPDAPGQCDILFRSACYSIKDERYPTEWTHDDDGCPTCTAFEPRK